MYHALNGVELTFVDLNDLSNLNHALQFFLCKVEGHSPPPAQAEPARVFELAVLPFYWETSGRRDPDPRLLLLWVASAEKTGSGPCAAAWK
jgi:hypothetical protein